MRKLKTILRKSVTAKRDQRGIVIKSSDERSTEKQDGIQGRTDDDIEPENSVIILVNRFF